MVVLHGITRSAFICQRDDNGYPISEDGFEGGTTPAVTAEWIWQANSKHKDYHKNMDGEGFEFWLEKRLIPAFREQFPGKKMILVMDNASYHHQLNTKYWSEGTTPASASKSINAHALRMAKCEHIHVVRGDQILKFKVPKVEPTPHKDHREMGFTAPATGKKGTVYGRFPHGPSTKELQHATAEWLRDKCPEALDSKVEALFRKNGWGIVWTPPYSPKFQPIELVWGVGKQRAARLYYKGRTLLDTRSHLRRGFYGGDSQVRGSSWSEADIAGCWNTALKEMNSWISQDLDHVADGLSGDLMNLVGVENWTASDSSCLDIKDMELDLEDELDIAALVDGGSDDDGDDDSGDEDE